MNLLIETHLFKPILRESKERPGVFEVEGVIQRANDRNQNGRVYRRPILERATQKYITEFVKNGIAYGELDHPESTIVSLKNASHIIKELWWKGNELMGRIELLDTPNGNIAKNIIKAGHTIGISSRGTGSVQQVKEGYLDVQEDFDLVCFDLVSNPSTIGAFLSPVSLNEGRQEFSPYTTLNTIINDILRS